MTDPAVTAPMTLESRGSRWPSAKEVVLVLLGYLAITAWYWWPMVLEPDSIWSVGRDFFQNTWNLWWVDYALSAGEPLLQTDRLFHPQGTSLAFQTWSPATTLPAWGLMQLFDLSVGAAYTVMFLAAFPLSAMGAWLLARHLSGSASASFAAGVFFAFNPYHTAMVTQLNNVQFQWLPLAVLGLLLIAEGRGWGAVALAGVATALCGYVDWYQPVFVMTAALLLLPGTLRRAERLKDVGTWLRLGAAALLALVLVAPGLLPMVEILAAGEGPAGLDSPIRYAGEVQLLGMSPKGTAALAAWPVILGWLTLVLIAWTLFRAFRSVSAGWWLLALLAFVLMQGARLTVMGDETSIPMPMAVFDHFPGLAFIRVPHRFLLLLVLAMAGILACGLAALQQRKGTPVVLGAALLIAVEMQPAAPESVRPTPAVLYAMIADDSEDYAVLELPLDFRDGYSMYLQTLHGKALTGGYTSHLLPGALKGLRSDVMRALLPSKHDNDVLDLPEHLPVDVPALDEATLEAWRRELVLEKRVRFVVMRAGTDFQSGTPAAQPETLEERLRVALTPFRFNTEMNDLQRLARPRVAEFRSQLVADSEQAAALVRRLFGDPAPRLGGFETEVWDLRPVYARMSAEAEEGR